MTDIIFVNQFDLEISEEQVLPLGLLSLSQVLKEEGLTAKICDFNGLYYQGKLEFSASYQVNMERMVDYLAKFDPIIVSFYTMANNYHVALSLCEQLKKQHPRVITIFAGPQATAVAVETLKCFPQVDLIAIGEGELTVGPIVRHLKKNGLCNLKDVDGIAFRFDQQVVVTEAKSHWIDDNHSNRNINVLEMELGRGCPFNCTYCSTSRFWGRNYRVKSIDRVIYEIKEYQRQFGTKIFLFQHDLFTFDKKYVLELCNRVLKENLQIKWACYARLDVIDEEMIRSMAKAGCIKLFFGLETGSPKIQDAVKKHLDVDKIFLLLDVLAECNVRITISFIYGFPQEEHHDLRQTLTLMYRIKDKSYTLCSSKKWVDVFISMLMYFANTQITDDFFDSLVFDETYFEATNKLHFLPSEVITTIKKHKKVFPQYYVMPKLKGKKHRYLSGFINAMFSSFFYAEHDLVSDIMQAYSGDVLALYLNIYEEYPEAVEKIYHCFYDEANEIGVMPLLYEILTKLKCLCRDGGG